MEQNVEAIETAPDLPGSPEAKGRGQDVLGLLMWALGAWFGVSIFLSMRDREPGQGLLTAPVVGLIDALGSWPGLVFSAGLAVLGTALFLRARGVDVGRHLLGLVGLTLGVALAVGAFGASAGGLVGSALPATLPGLPGSIAALVLGVLVLVVSVWLTWVGTLAGALEPTDVRAVGSLSPEEVEGVSTAEAAALLRTPEPLPEASAFPGGPSDVRLRGGVPAGTRPLDGDRRGASFRPAEDDDESAAAEDAVAEPAVAREPAVPSGARPLEDEDFPRPFPRETARISGTEERGDPGASLAEGVRSLGGAATVLERAGGGSPVTPAWELEDSEEEPHDEPVFEVEDRLEVEEAPEEIEAEAEAEAEVEPEVEEVEASAEEEAPGEPVLAPKEWEQAGLFDEAEELEEPEAARATLVEEVEADEEEEEAEPEEDEELAEADDDEEYEDEEEYEEEDDDGEYAEADEDGDEEEEYEDEEEDDEEYAEAEEDEEEEEAEAEPEEVELVPAARTEPEPPAPVKPSSGPKAARTPRELLFEAGCLILEENRVAVSMLERRFELDFDQACGLLDELQNEGLIGPYMGGRTRDILLDREAWEARAGASSSA